MIPWLTPDEDFPDTAQALGPESEAPGLLAASGDISAQRLAQSYRQGIFPWYSQGQPVLWWTTDPRMVLPVSEFKVSRSLRKTLRAFWHNPTCEVRIDSAFERVMQACAQTPRDGQDGTWIQPELQSAYVQWHREGAVHSFETWIDGELVGGLYGVCIGRMFFGESMFANQTDASKIALAGLVCFCRARGIELIDCQQQTAHLASLGARPWPRAQFESHLRQAVAQAGPRLWSYDDSDWSQLDGIT